MSLNDLSFRKLSQDESLQMKDSVSVVDWTYKLPRHCLTIKASWSPDITLPFFGGEEGAEYIKEHVFTAPLTKNTKDLKHRI